MRSVWAEYGLTKYAFKEAVSATLLGRWNFEQFALLRAALASARSDYYDRARAICQALRLLEGRPIHPQLIRRFNQILLDANHPGGDGNRLRTSFLKSSAADRAARRYLQHGTRYAAAMKFPRVDDDVARQGNLVVLKAPSASEKGVLYLQYTESIREFVALFDMARVAAEYRLVLEPSTWGYQDESYLLLVHPGFDVLVQAQDPVDYRHIASLKTNLIPMPMGAGDWIDPENFISRTVGPKQFDFVMVASWSPVKRHTVLFWALAQAGLAQSRIALIGYPWEGRTRTDIEKAARRAGLVNVTIFERIPRAQVAEVISNSSVGVMLTRREGANRGIYECLFCDVPVVVPSYNRGVNKAHINEATGILAADDDALPNALVSALSGRSRFHPRAWVTANTGYVNANKALDDALRGSAARAGESYSQGIAPIRSSPAARYVHEADRLRLQGQYVELEALLRSR